MLNILFLSHTYWGSEFRVGSHHLSKNMAEMGHKVIYIPTPITPFHLIKYKASDTRIKNSGKLTQIHENLSQYIPRTLIPAGEVTTSSGFDFGLISTGIALRSIMAEKNIKKFDIIFLDQPKLYGLTQLVKHTTLIYRPTDILSGIGLRGTAKYEKLSLKSSSGLITTSQPVLDHLKKNFIFDVPQLTLVNGVDLELFTTPAQPPADISGIIGKKCIYVGAFDDRFDFDGMLQIIKNNLDINFILIGPFPPSKAAEFTALKNAHILGIKDFHQIPAYMQACDISIMPFSNNPSNEGRSPMKLYEYLAAGLPVVSRYTDEISRRDHPRILTYKNISEASYKLQQALTLEKKSSAPDNLSWQKITGQALRFATSLSSPPPH